MQSVDWPHSNLASVLTETGIAGFVPYLALHVLLLTAMWQLRRKSASGRLVWKYFFFMFLIYWVTGLMESSGFESTVNLTYAFAAAVLYKYALTEPYSSPAEQQTEQVVPSARLPEPVPANTALASGDRIAHVY